MAALLSVDAAAQVPPQVRFSTHDQTVSAPSLELVFNETWADVKSPGGFPVTAVTFPPGQPATLDSRNDYVVGTIEVNVTQGGMFSGHSVGTGGPNGPSPFTTLGSATQRQVAILQVNNAANAIVTQQYFYGSSLGANDPLRATNARGISVWRTPSPQTDRIAICGETYDEVLPASQSASGWTAASANHPSGFIAVFDGSGQLRWTHHFFDPANGGDRDCAITDVSVRVDAEGNDVVTYCGISSHGSPAGGELAPLLEFAPSGACNGGAPTLPSGQWDGFVGRVTATGPSTSRRLFHSVVGGPGQDGLFGIVEIDEDRFAVAGSSVAGSGLGGFPFPSQCGLVGPYALGAVLVFDASGTSLALERGEALGAVGSDLHTVARDIHLGRSVFSQPNSTDDFLYVVGSTDNQEGNPGFSAGQLSFAIMPPAGQDALNGPTDGFVAAMWMIGGTTILSPWTYSYHGGAGNDGLTGINGWNEFSEHFTVTGFTDDGAGATDIDVATYLFNNAAGPAAPPSFTGPPNNSGQLLLLRRLQVGGTNQDLPAAMGLISATTSGLAWSTFQLGQESGGGVAVGAEGRIDVAGCTVVGGGYPIQGAGARGPDQARDAVRTVLDLVPVGAASIGVGRTDGTGIQGGGAPSFPPAPATGYTGGTTPFCAQAEFGVQIGMPAPGMQRMLIDFEGSLSGGSTNAAIVISRPTAQAGVMAIGGLQFGFPPATPALTITGAEVWLGAPTTFWAFGPNVAFRLPMSTLPLGGGGPVSAQLVCMLSSPVTGPVTGCSSLYTASPALWFNW